MLKRLFVVVLFVSAMAIAPTQALAAPRYITSHAGHCAHITLYLWVPLTLRWEILRSHALRSGATWAYVANDNFKTTPKLKIRAQIYRSTTECGGPIAPGGDVSGRTDGRRNLILGRFDKAFRIVFS